MSPGSVGNLEERRREIGVGFMPSNNPAPIARASFGLGRFPGRVLVRIVRDNPEGFTVNTVTGRLYEIGVDRGYVVATGHDELVLADLDQVAIIDWVNTIDAVTIGGWFDSDTRLYSIEPVEIIPHRSQALRLGEIRNQKAIFDLATGTEIPSSAETTAVVPMAALSS